VFTAFKYDSGEIHTDETHSNKLYLNYDDEFAAKIAMKPTNNPSPPHALQTALTFWCRNIVF
jgi:hypothetical protein